MSYYEVLQVGEAVGPEEIRAAYLRLVQQYHPDRHVGNAPGGDGRERFQQIQEAYEVLHDPDQRKAYDHHRSIVPRPRTERRTAVVTPTRRRDVPHEWLHRRVPYKKKKFRMRRLLFLGVFALLVTMVVPQCSRILESDLLLPTLLPASADLPASAESDFLVDGQIVDAPAAAESIELHDSAVPSKKKQLKSLNPADSAAARETGDNERPRKFDANSELQPWLDDVPDLQTLEWLSNKESPDWSPVITASSERNPIDLTEIIQASATDEGARWEPAPVTSNSRAFEQAPPGIARFESQLELSHKQVWPQGRFPGRSTKQAQLGNSEPYRGLGIIREPALPRYERFFPPHGAFPKSLPERAFGAPSMGRPGEADRSPSQPELNYGFARPHAEQTAPATTGLNAGIGPWERISNIEQGVMDDE